MNTQLKIVMKQKYDNNRIISVIENGFYVEKESSIVVSETLMEHLAFNKHVSGRPRIQLKVLSKKDDSLIGNFDTFKIYNIDYTSNSLVIQGMPEEILEVCKKPSDLDKQLAQLKTLEIKYGNLYPQEFFRLTKYKTFILMIDIRNMKLFINDEEIVCKNKILKKVDLRKPFNTHVFKYIDRAGFNHVIVNQDDEFLDLKKGDKVSIDSFGYYLPGSKVRNFTKTKLFSLP